MTTSPFDHSSGARARRRARHEAELRDLMASSVQVRQRRFVLVFFAACALTTLGVIGSALGWWS